MVKAKVDGGGSLVDSCKLQVARGCGQLQVVVTRCKRLCDHRSRGELDAGHG